MKKTEFAEIIFTVTSVLCENREATGQRTKLRKSVLAACGLGQKRPGQERALGPRVEALLPAMCWWRMSGKERALGPSTEASEREAEGVGGSLVGPGLQGLEEAAEGPGNMKRPLGPASQGI